MKNQLGIFAGTLVLAVGLSACAPEAAETPDATNERTTIVTDQEPERMTATYDIVNTEGERIGRVELLDGAGGLLLKVEVNGLEPGVHGLHVHETGRCEPPFGSAGGHYAPASHAHGLLSEDGPHAGDLPNLVVGDEASTATAHVWAHGLSVTELTRGDGSALVIHAAADDYRTDPAGAAGDRVACAAILRS